MGSFYRALSIPTEDTTRTLVYGIGAGAVLGAGAAAMARSRKASAKAAHYKVSVEDMEKSS
jgi:hypothetical protein